jgi:hypothetical protein
MVFKEEHERFITGLNYETFLFYSSLSFDKTFYSLVNIFVCSNCFDNVSESIEKYTEFISSYIGFFKHEK